MNPFVLNLEEQIFFQHSIQDMFVAYGISETIRKYFDLDKIRIGSLPKILKLFHEASFAYIQFYSMQRVSEVSSLHDDCLKIEHDKRFGDIHTLVGVTTKTESDSDARWIVPERVVYALDVAKDISRFVFSYVGSKNKYASKSIPLNIPYSHLGLSGGSSTHRIQTKVAVEYKVIKRVFSEHHMTITREDFEFAKALTPTIIHNQNFQIGKPWKWSSHQCRRTMIVYMLSSGLISIQSVQYLAKHMNSYMTQYYGRNYTNLVLNKQIEKDFIFESYLSKARAAQRISSNQNPVVLPHKMNKTLNFVSEKTKGELISKFKASEIGLRPTLLGFCAKAGYCEYGGVESISQCTGSNGGGICAEAIFAIDKHESLIKLKTKYEEEYATLPNNSMRRKSLGYEIKAIDIYLGYVPINCC